MRRLVEPLAVVPLLAALFWAAGAQKEQRLRFEPVRVISAVEAKYPVTSIAAGTVILEVTVGESGAIDAIKVINDIPSLTEEAERTVRQWKFKPARLEGKTVAAPIITSFTFSRPIIYPSDGY